MKRSLLVKKEEFLEHCDSGVGAPIHHPLDPLLLKVLFGEGFQGLVGRVA